MTVKKEGKSVAALNCASTNREAPEMLKNKAWLVCMYCVKKSVGCL